MIFEFEQNILKVSYYGSIHIFNIRIQAHTRAYTIQAHSTHACTHELLTHVRTLNPHTHTHTHTHRTQAHAQSARALARTI